MLTTIDATRFEVPLYTVSKRGQDRGRPGVDVGDVD